MPAQKQGGNKQRDDETRRETKRTPPRITDPETARETRRITQPKKPKKTQYSGPFVGFDPSSTIKIKPKTGGGNNNNGGGGGNNGGGTGGGPEEVVSTPVETVVGNSGIVDGVNYKEEYISEIKRLVLSLVNNSKALLLRYNFSGIDRVPEYYLDADVEARSEAISSSFSRPESPFTLQEADLQDKFSLDLNEINNKISDLSNSAQKSNYFGSMRGGTFIPKEVKLLANGSVGYDMRLTFNSVSNQDFVIKCYEVS